MYVTANQYPYDFWEQLAVSEHLLLVPNRHITTMEDLTEAERKEYTDIVCRYEAIGYDVYTRAPNSQIRSVMHIHTHLIKTRGRGSRAYLNIRKPYFLTRW
jgi:diadenosine tetraphosphate (Ap4A) HIT family hydrolase